MTQFELFEDFRTYADEAMELMNIDRDTINRVTDHHDLYTHLTPAKRKIALAAVHVYKMYKYRPKTTSIRSSQAVYDEMAPDLCDMPNEESWVLYLNNSCHIIDKKRIGVGGITETSVDIRIILKGAIMAGATHMILCHNHPSGNRQPSRQDDRLTQQLAQAGKVMNVNLTDHVIIAGDNFYSYADEGKL